VWQIKCSRAVFSVRHPLPSREDGRRLVRAISVGNFKHVVPDFRVGFLQDLGRCFAAWPIGLRQGGPLLFCLLFSLRCEAAPQGVVIDPDVFRPSGLIQIECEPRFAIGRHIFDAAYEAGVCPDIRQGIGIGDKTKDFRKEIPVWLDIFERFFDLTAPYWHFIIERRGFIWEQYQSKLCTSNGYAAWNQYNASIYSHAAIVVRNPLKFENGLLVHGTQQIEEWNKPHAEGWGMPYICHDESQFELSIPCGRICQWASYFHLARNPWAQCHERGIGRFLGSVGGRFADSYGGSHIAGLGSGSLGQKAQLTFAGIPQPVGSSFQCQGESGNGNGGEGRKNAPHTVKNLRDFNSKEWKELIAGAVFFLGLFGYFAYWVVTRDERKNQNDKGRASTEPK
jgi:hypothetical protein